MSEKSIGIALQNIKANPLHTILSTLGIIIGIASLVAILAVGDGLEKFGREQVGSTTSLEFMSINSRQTETIDGIRVPIKNRTALTYNDYQAIKEVVGDRAAADMFNRRTAVIQLKGDTANVATFLFGRSEGFTEVNEFQIEGRFFTQKEIREESKLIVLSTGLANKFTEEQKRANRSNCFDRGQ